MAFFKITRVTLTLLALLALTSCSIFKPYDKLKVVAAENVNPDGNQRPSPIQLKIFQLTSRTTVDNMDFDSLFYHADVILSDELLSTTTYMVVPKETIKTKLKLLPNAHYIAIVAAYRDIDQSQWKHIYQVSPHGHYKHIITLGDAEIIVGNGDTAE